MRRETSTAPEVLMTNPTRAPSLVTRRSGHHSPFFRSKFRIPMTPGHVVRRPRLCDLLDDLLEYSLTAIVAPAGAGKTVLAADWVRHSSFPCAWLTLDESDRDPAQFWMALTGSLDELAPGIATRGKEWRGDHEDALRAVLDGLGRTGRVPGVLVIDEIQRIEESDQVCNALASFAEHKPPDLHVLMLSRHSLPLPVQRLRAAGELADVHFDVLRMSEGEAAEMLARLCPDLTPDEQAAAIDRAGGWAAALQLAALAFRAHRHAPGGVLQVASSDKLVDEYVWHEVLRAERRELIDLMLAISVVPRVNHGLAEALTDDDAVGHLLEEAESRGLFLTSLDAGGWYEVHSLVRDMMLIALERRSPAGLRAQHARAAKWFESVSDGEAALRHWLEAGRHDEALRVLADVVVDVVEADRGASVAGVLDRIAVDAVATDLEALVRIAWCEQVLDRGRVRAAVSAAESLDGGPPTTPHVLLGVLRALATIRCGDWSTGERALLEALDHVGERDQEHPIARHGWAQVACSVANDERWDDGGPVERDVRRAASSDARRRLSFEGTRAVGLARAGRPLESLLSVAQVRQAAEQARKASLRSQLCLADAIVAREIGDRERAGHELERLAGQASPFTFARLLGQLELTQLRICEGRVADADAAFLEAERVVHHQLEGSNARGGASYLASVGTLLGLAKDDLHEARRWSRRVTDEFWGPVSEARVDLAAGCHDVAVDTVARAEPRCPRHHVVHGLVLAAALAPQDRDAAAKVTGVAIEVAAEHGMLQSAAPEYVGVMDLVELAAWRVPDPWLDRLRRLETPAWAGTPAPRWPMEELTNRERDVLRLLPSRLTLREVAAELFVSQNTLNFHLRLINRMLGAGSRADAVRAARAQGLLPRA
jgi:LuxR family maltose regulon positive regulatory protein